jgi:hypothetical protein
MIGGYYLILHSDMAAGRAPRRTLPLIAMIGGYCAILHSDRAADRAARRTLPPIAMVGGYHTILHSGVAEDRAVRRPPYRHNRRIPHDPAQRHGAGRAARRILPPIAMIGGYYIILHSDMAQAGPRGAHFPLSP